MKNATNKQVLSTFIFCQRMGSKQSKTTNSCLRLEYSPLHKGFLLSSIKSGAKVKITYGYDDDIYSFIVNTNVYEPSSVVVESNIKHNLNKDRYNGYYKGGVWYMSSDWMPEIIN